MQISVHCDCGRMFATKSENAGKKAKCPGCGKIITIPIASTDSEIDEWLSPLAGSRQEPLPRTIPPVPPPSSKLRGPTPNRPTADRSPARAKRKSPDEISLLEWNPTILTGLIDWKFRTFITPSIVSSLYTAHLILTTLALTGLVLGNYWALIRSPARSDPYFYLALIGLDASAVLLALIWTLVVRLCLEAVMVIFRGEEHLRVIADWAQSKAD